MSSSQAAADPAAADQSSTSHTAAQRALRRRQSVALRRLRTAPLHRRSADPNTNESAFLQLALAATGALIACLDRHGRILDLSPALCERLGYTRSELLGQPFQGVEPLISDGRISLTDKQGRPVQLQVTLRNQQLAGQAVQLAVLAELPGQPPFHDTDWEAHLLQILAQQLADVIWVYDPHTQRFRYVSPSAQRLTGYTATELMQLRIEEILTPASLPLVYEQLPARLQRFLEGDPDAVTQLDQIEQRLRNGSTVWTEVSTTLFRVPDGQVLVLGVSRDISSRYQAEQALRTSEALLRELINHIDQIFWLYDLEQQRLLYLSPAYERISGVPVEQGMRSATVWFDLIHPDDRTPSQIYFPTLLAERRAEAHYRIIRPDGGIRWIHERAFAVPDAQGQITRLAGLSLDVTEQYAQVEYRRLYEQIVSATADLLAFVDCDLIYRAVNDSYLRVHACSREEIVGKHMREILGQHVFEQQVRPRMQQLLQGQVSEMRYADWFEARGVGRRYVDVLYQPYRDRNGAISGIVISVHDITEHKLHEERLRHEHALLRSLIDSIPDLIFIKDSRGHYVGCNRAFESLVQLTEAELLGKSVLDLFPRDDALQYQRTDQQIFRDRQPTRAEQWFTFSDGRRLLLDVLKTPFYGPDGELRGLIGICRDLSERKRAEEQLRRSEQLLKASQQIMHVGSYEVDLTTWSTIWSEEVFHIYGISPQTRPMPASEVVRYIHPDDRARVAAHAQHIMTNADSTAIEYRILRADGSIRIVLSEPRVEHDEHGRPLRVLGALLDITDIRRLEEERARLAAIIEFTPDIVGIGAVNGSILYLNPAGQRFFGIHDPASLANYRIQDLHPPEVYRDLIAPALPVVLEQGAWIGESVIRAPDGREVPVSQVILRHSDQQGRVDRVSTIMRDIGERKRADQRLRQAAIVFESTVEGVVITDPHSRIVAVNPAFTIITGYTEAEVLAQTPRLLRSDRHDAGFYKAMWTSIEQTGRWQGEVWNRRKNGEIFPEWLTISSVLNERGEVQNYIGVFSDISRIKESEAQLARMAHYDPLTELPNRLLLSSRLDHALERAQRERHKVAILFVDLDRFKTINDSLGHPAGDELLVAIAGRLRKRLRSADTIARLGGDEFVVLLEGLHTADAAALVAEELLELLHQPFLLSGGHEVYADGTIGISIHPDDASDATQLIRNADTAMYHAKSAGGNSYRFYAEAMTRSAHERLETESKLRRAIERGELLVYYQPQSDISSQRIIGIEALARWQHPGEGLILPARFIPLAEETGLIGLIGEQLLFEACRQVQRWREHGLSELILAVNLSPRQFRQPGLVAVVSSVLEQTGLPAECLELELTESIIIDQWEHAASTLNALKALGVKTAVDDFGTGYSSLVYLKRFAIDKLKIDRSFIKDLPHNANDAMIAATIIAMGHNLGLQVIAEGVETEAQLQFLLGHNCDAYQGYLYSRPVPVDVMTRLLGLPE